jgi:predicted dinucleotide-binding enzyme
MQAKLPKARVGKAFTTLWTGFIAEHAQAKPCVAMTLAADLPEDRKVIGDLIEQVGLEPVDLGALADSRPLDPPSPIWDVVLTASELTERV